MIACFPGREEDLESIAEERKMSEQNKAFVRKFFEVMDSADNDALRELMHPDHVFNFPLAPQPLSRDGHMGLCQGFQAGFSKIQHKVLDQFAEGDKVVTRGVVTVHHTGEFNGIAATNKTIEFGFINIMRIEDGKNREEWDELDGLKFLKELGAIPS